MRTIKFRGKRVDNGEWVYGDLVRDHVANEYPYIMSRNEGGCYITMQSMYMHKIYRYTVGQFTGLLDKNGVEIYDGDCMTECGEVVFHDGAFCFADLTGHQNPSRIAQDRVRRLAITGNIHEGAR